MKKDKYASQLAQKTQSRNVWRTGFFICLLSNLLLAVFVLTADTTEKTIFEPTNFTKSFWVKGEQVDPNYIEQISLDFIENFLTYHPENAWSRFSEVLEFTDPSVYGEMKAFFENEYKKIKATQLSSVCHPLELHVKQLQADVTCRLVGYVGQNQASDDIKTMRLHYAFRGGRLSITGFALGTIDHVGQFIAEESSKSVADLYR